MFYLTGEPSKLDDYESADWIPSQNLGYTAIETQDQKYVIWEGKIKKSRFPDQVSFYFCI